jgi:F0F1-type ATP synthase membrane subunit c/vacuolar-type H+-ATPase subunit K
VPVSQLSVRVSQLAAWVTSSVRSFRAHCATPRLLTASRAVSSAAAELLGLLAFVVAMILIFVA